MYCHAARNTHRLLLDYVLNKAFCILCIGTQHFSEGQGTTCSFEKNEFLCEYAGELISHAEGVKREGQYSTDKTHDNSKCYIYFFKHAGKGFLVWELCVYACTIYYMSACELCSYVFMCCLP